MWSLAAAGMALETAGLVGMAATVLWGLTNGSASTTSRAITEGICLLLLALGTGLLAVNLLRRKGLAKTPTLLWNAMLFAVAISLLQGGGGWIGWLTIALSALTFLVTLPLPRYDLHAEE